MKIGIVFSGHLRSFRETKTTAYSFIENLKKLGEVDLFCHCWDIEESLTGSWWKKGNDNTSEVKFVNEAEFTSIYSPTSYKIEQSKDFDDSSYTIQSPVPVRGYLSMFYSANESFKLLLEYEKKKGFKYDILIRTRYDIDYEIAEDFTEVLEKLHLTDNVIMPNSNPYELSGGYSDIFAIGSRNKMEIYLEFYNNFRCAVENFLKKGYNELFPELCLPHYLIDNSCSLEKLDKLRISIVRKSGERFNINSARSFTNNKPGCFSSTHAKRNWEMLNKNAFLMDQNTSIVVRRYISWLDGLFDEHDLNKCVIFYKGGWIGLKLMFKLIKSARNSNVFDPGVMRSFFEQSMHNATYSSNKKILLAFVLLLRGNYGFFFFRVWRHITFTKRQ